MIDSYISDYVKNTALYSYNQNGLIVTYIPVEFAWLFERIIDLEPFDIELTVYGSRLLMGYIINDSVIRHSYIYTNTQIHSKLIRNKVNKIFRNLGYDCELRRLSALSLISKVSNGPKNITYVKLNRKNEHGF